MDREELLKLRHALGATQSEMATAMGAPFRTYQAVEAGKNPLRPIHERAAAWAVVNLALAKDKPEVIPPAIADLLKRAAEKLACSTGRGNLITSQ